mgnify:CR=1 FL=1|jgi:hypothetical protein|tara:strand:- start:2624 stop:3388 length:765 start_codon:yes stop_codon:yes gene_type:complete
MIKKKLKKKRILVLGCSFSRGAYASEQYSQSEAKCWPQILAEKYRDSDWWVFNTATCGNTDAMMMLELEHYTKNNEWDMVVVQNTTPARATFMHDSKQARDYINIKKLENVTENYLHWYHENNQTYNETGTITKNRPILNTNVSNSIKYMKNSKLFKSHVKFLEVSCGPYGFERNKWQEAMQLYINHLLKKRGVNFIQYEHLNNTTGECVDFQVKGDLFDEKMWDKMTVDVSHLSTEGNIILASHIGEMIEDRL